MAKLKRNHFLKWTETALPYMLFTFIGYAVADLAILNYRDLMLPNQPPPSPPKRRSLAPENSKAVYNIIISRNVFNSEGTIPDALLPKGEDKKKLEDLPPVPSNLPLALMGTIVHSNPERSIANIELKGKNMVLPYSLMGQKEIENLATLVKIERGKVIFRNSNNQQLEFLEMKLHEKKITFSSSKPAQNFTPSDGGEVMQTAPNKFELKRSDVLKYTSDMGAVLQQAAMAPKRNANGEIECFKFLSIQPGSIYTQLGFQAGDCIKSVNGEKVDSPAKAMEMYNALKTSNNIKIGVERDGRDSENDYTVK